MSSAATLTTVHLERAAYVYIRQSSEFQVQNHVERQRLQHALADHAKELGFRDIEVVDDDLGISGVGVHRPGFDALLGAVCKGRVGLVLSIEAARLSRNGRGVAYPARLLRHRRVPGRRPGAALPRKTHQGGRKGCFRWHNGCGINRLGHTRRKQP